MTDHRAWAKMLAEKALARFGARVWFMGLQGSVRRGATTESSDIDFVLILDRLDTADLSAYRELVRSMPDSEKACGFVSGRKELLAWPRADLFQFYHDTEALYGSLSEVGALLCPQDARGALHMGAANVYHAACHSFLFEDASANLPALYKAAFFVLQAQAFAASGVYCEDAAALERQDRLLLGYFGNGFCSLITDGNSEILEVARQGVLLLEQHYGDYVKVKDLRTRRDSHA